MDAFRRWSGKNETLEECCVREVSEETGYLVKPIKEYLVMNEYYEECRYVSHFFVCEVIGQREQKLTEAEKVRGLVPRWVERHIFIPVSIMNTENIAI